MVHFETSSRRTAGAAPAHVYGRVSVYVRNQVRRLRALPVWIGLAARTYRERRALRRVDAAMLKDIGLSRADVEREAGRPFWDLPDRT
jgi:uncharacterized protein YjiS (DUF1127 family)